MNKHAQIDKSVGIIIIVAITLIVGLIFFQAIAQSVGDSTNTVYLANQSLGTATNGTAIYIDYRSINTGGSDFHIINGTVGITVASPNYTVTNNVINPTTGELSVSILPHANTGYYGVGNWYISGTAQPTTYIAEGGGRAMAGLIAVFFALAIVLVAMSPIVQGKLMDMIS